MTQQNKSNLENEFAKELESWQQRFEYSSILFHEDILFMCEHGTAFSDYYCKIKSCFLNVDHERT